MTKRGGMVSAIAVVGVVVLGIGSGALARASGSRATFDHRSPLGSIDEICRRYRCNRDRLEAAFPGAGAYSIAEESFFVAVPEPPAGPGPDGRYGLLVWLSPTDRGDQWFERFATTLAERRLIFASANRAGNQRPKWDRLALALDAVDSLTRDYPVDPGRIWVGGYSGGGRLAGHLQWLYPEIFRGAILGFGCDSPWNLPAPGAGGDYRAAFPLPVLDSLAGRPIAVVTGSDDFNRAECLAVYQRMRAEGLDGTLWLEVPRAGHSLGVTADWLATALDHLAGAR